MHFHLPKPMHGWREFAGEVGIIVVGVLIALGAEQLLEDWRWHRQLEQANQAFKTELMDASAIAYERLIVQPCLTNRLKAIAAQLDQQSPAWRGMPEHFNGASAFYLNVLPVVYRPPYRFAVTDSWSNALANGTINHLPAERAQMLAGAYGAVHYFLDSERDETVAETKLGPLGTDRQLNAESRLQMLQVVSDLDRLNNDIVTDGDLLMEAVQKARLGYDRAETDKVRRVLLKLQRGYRGNCVRDLPLDLK